MLYVIASWNSEFESYPHEHAIIRIPDSNQDPTYLGDEDEAEEKRHGELTVTEEDDVEEVGIGGTLEKEPVEHTNTNNE